jgi:elongation factor P hydroxylase
MTLPESVVLEELFAETFLKDWNTILAGGGDEPVYLPADDGHRYHRIIYREDYFSSALHETAHWCIAGEVRRQQVDFGYWYQPDGRDRHQQRAFEQVEVKPQALEWLFTTAAGRPFRLSADNLSSLDTDSRGPSPTFVAAVEEQARIWCVNGALPRRGQQFIEVLANHYGVRDVLDAGRYEDLAG